MPKNVLFGYPLYSWFTFWSPTCPRFFDPVSEPPCFLSICAFFYNTLPPVSVCIRRHLMQTMFMINLASNRQISPTFFLICVSSVEWIRVSFFLMSSMTIRRTVGVWADRSERWESVTERRVSMCVGLWVSETSRRVSQHRLGFGPTPASSPRRWTKVTPKP